MMTALGPMMLSMTAGSLVGHLASRALGQYDLPIPHPPGDEIMVVVPSIDEFASGWSLTPDDVRLWVCLHEITTHAVLQVPHVREHLGELLDAWAGGFQPDSSALEERLGSLEINDISDLQKLQSTLGDPEILLGAIQSDHQRALLPRLEALVQAITGYTDHVMDRIGGSLISDYGMLTEALRRRRVGASQADRFVERLLGLEMTSAAYERGERFVDGIVERAGEDGLAELWTAADNLPTPSELDAPGLWLARIGFEYDFDDEDLGSTSFDDADLGELGIDPGPGPDEDPPTGD
jgi:putative hydrolase